MKKNLLNIISDILNFANKKTVHVSDMFESVTVVCWELELCLLHYLNYCPNEGPGYYLSVTTERHKLSLVWHHFSSNDIGIQVWDCFNKVGEETQKTIQDENKQREFCFELLSALREGTRQNMEKEQSSALQSVDTEMVELIEGILKRTDIKFSYHVGFYKNEDRESGYSEEELYNGSLFYKEFIVSTEQNDKGLLFTFHPLFEEYERYCLKIGDKSYVLSDATGKELYKICNGAYEEYEKTEPQRKAAVAAEKAQQKRQEMLRALQQFR